MIKIIHYLLAFSLIFGSTSCESKEPNANVQGSNSIASWGPNETNYEELMGSRKIGESFSKILLPVPATAFTPKTPSASKCLWNSNIENSENDDNTVMCLYSSSDGFLYKVEGETIIGVVLKPNANKKLDRYLPFNLQKASGPNELISVMKHYGHNPTIEKIDEPGLFQESVCLSEGGIGTKAICFSFDRSGTLTQIEIWPSDNLP